MRAPVSPISQCHAKKTPILFIVLSIALLLPLAVGAEDLPSFTFCVFRRITGLDCPACGMTRAFLWAGRGQWSKAFAAHPAGPLVWLWSVWKFLLSGVRLSAGKPEPPLSLWPPLSGAILLVILWTL